MWNDFFTQMTEHEHQIKWYYESIERVRDTILETRFLKMKCVENWIQTRS